MDCWTYASELSIEMYQSWMSIRKGRRKARYYKKLARMKNRLFAKDCNVLNKKTGLKVRF